MQGRFEAKVGLWFPPDLAMVKGRSGVVVNESGCSVRAGRLDEPVSGGGMVESGRR